MLAGLKTLARHTLTFAVVGAMVGILLGAVSNHYVQMVAGMTLVGGAFGVAIGYGFLPEK
jgi:hypothetical protein